LALYLHRMQRRMQGPTPFQDRQWLVLGCQDMERLA
jgi:hypothetical protein